MNEIYDLTVDEFIELQQTGVLYKLFPKLKGTLINVQQFEQKKKDYQLQQALYNFVFDIVEMTGADPAEIMELVEEHKDNIKLFIDNLEHCDIGDIVEQLRSE